MITPPGPGEQETAAAPFAARAVPLEPGFYAFGLADEAGWHDPRSGLALPAIHLCPAPGRDHTVEIGDSYGGAERWLGGRHRMLFVKIAKPGGTIIVTAYLARDPDSPPADLEIRRLDGWIPSGPVISGAAFGPEIARSLPPIATLNLGGASAGPRIVALIAVAHIRSQGDVRFAETPWIGRLGPGLWIEAFGLLPRDRRIAAALEYKGLIANGAETPWIGAGAPCGTRGQGLPLVGFAVRQKATSGGALFDCEYSGYFASGQTTGPMRNGAPCRSPAANDPLEGLQVQITTRPGRG